MPPLNTPSSRFPTGRGGCFRAGRPRCTVYRTTLRLGQPRRFTAVQCAQGTKEEDSRAEALLQRTLRGLQREGRISDPKRLQKLLDQSLQKTQGSSNGASTQPGSSSSRQPGDEDESAWDLVNLKAYMQPWQVPWGAGETVGGFALWVGGFVATGVLVVPLLAYFLKLPGLGGGTADDKALLALFNQLLETAVGLAAINLVVSRSKPLSEDLDLFVVDPKGPFRKPDGWLSWGLLGISIAPVVILVSALLLSFVGYDEVAGSGRGTVDAVAGIIQLSPVSYLSLLGVTAVLAPVLEETVFRGFLMASLTKFMPTPAAVVLSSVAFGAAHLSVRDFPQLFALGLVLGFSYVRSRNLLTPMFIHAMWNGSVLTTLYLLTAAGVDIQSLLAAR